MDEKEFKHHLRDLAHGHHHPEEHDWGADGVTKQSEPARRKRTATTKTKRKAIAAKK